jgi:hypothetical protein
VQRRNLEKLKNLRPIKKRERPWENRLRDELEDNFPVMFTKAKPTRTGWPDRIAAGYGNLRLVEVKRDDEDLDEGQVIMHRQLLAMDVRVIVVKSSMGLKQAALRIVRGLKNERLCGCKDGAFCKECY